MGGGTVCQGLDTKEMGIGEISVLATIMQGSAPMVDQTNKTSETYIYEGWGWVLLVLLFDQALWTAYRLKQLQQYEHWLHRYPGLD